MKWYMIWRRNFTLVYRNDAAAKNHEQRENATERDSREETNTKAADNPSDDHGPEASGEGLYGAADGENDCSAQQRSLSSNDIANPSGSK